jgi:hypothetical protein
MIQVIDTGWPIPYTSIDPNEPPLAQREFANSQMQVCKSLSIIEKPQAVELIVACGIACFDRSAHSQITIMFSNSQNPSTVLSLPMYKETSIITSLLQRLVKLPSPSKDTPF